MKKPKIVVTSPMNFLPRQEIRLKLLGDVTIYNTLPNSPEEWLERCKGAEIICSGKYGLQEKIYENKGVFYSLPFVAVGWINKNKLKEKNMTVSYCPGCNSYAVSEWIIGMTFLLMRKFHRLVNTQKVEDKTGSKSFLGLAQKKVCVLGKGNVGSKVGKVFESLDMNVSYFVRGDNLIDKVKDCDIVIDALGHNETTEGLLNNKFFNSFKKRAFFITVTSQKIYDTEAMIAALDSGKLGGAATDCGSILPGDFEDPYYKKLSSHPRILATPHISYQSDVTVRISNDMMIDNIEAYLKGKPINLVN